MEQMGRNVTMQKWGFLANSRYLLPDRGWQGENHAPTSQESEFEPLCGTLGEIGETRMPVEAHLVRGETAAPSPAAIRGPLPRGARNHQGKQNRLLFPLPNRGASGENGIVRCKERLGGLLKYYEREAA
jgi:hypothetical protein